MIKIKNKEIEKDLNALAYTCKQFSGIVDNTLGYIEKLETKVGELGRGQHTLMQSRRKWKNRYYKERQKNRKGRK